MKDIIKKVAAIHDLSGFGRGSLTSIIPILSTMGIQACPLPTAILSTHTTGFDDFSFLDLSSNMVETTNHWEKLGLNFDCIYSGFLGSSDQINIVSNFIDKFRTSENLIVVDPVLGDNGKLYSTMDEVMVTKMRDLIEKADIIFPNFTEICLLLGKDYDTNQDEEVVKSWLKELSALGPNIVIGTSLPDNSDSNKKFSNTIAYDRENNIFWKVKTELLPASYPGTGDAYASVVIGNLLDGESLPASLDKATHFIKQCIQVSFGYKYDSRNGILIEKVLPTLNLPLASYTYEISY